MNNYLTEQDEQNYGRDLIDFAQRAAANAVAPHLQHLEQQNIELQRRLAMEARRNLDQRVEAVVPDFRQRDQDPRFHEYLREIDPLSGRPRQTLLNDAIASGDAARIANFFYGYDGSASAHQCGGQGASRTAPRSRSQAPLGSGPVYTNESIRQLYANRRKGMYDDATWARLEADLFEAQRSNRLNVRPFMSK
jgi:hypothetical protein